MEIGAAPGRVNSPPTSRISAPASLSARPCSMAAASSAKSPPSEKLSGVTLTTPMMRGRSSARPAKSARGLVSRSMAASKASARPRPAAQEPRLADGQQSPLPLRHDLAESKGERTAGQRQCRAGGDGRARGGPPEQSLGPQGKTPPRGGALAVIRHLWRISRRVAARAPARRVAPDRCSPAGRCSAPRPADAAAARCRHRRCGSARRAAGTGSRRR